MSSGKKLDAAGAVSFSAWVFSSVTSESYSYVSRSEIGALLSSSVNSSNSVSFSVSGEFTS